MDGVNIGKVGKSENSKTDEEQKDQDEEKLCKSVIKALHDAIVRNTRYWQRLEKKSNASCALMASPAKNGRGMKCAKHVKKN